MVHTPQKKTLRLFNDSKLFHYLKWLSIVLILLIILPVRFIQTRGIVGNLCVLNVRSLWLMHIFSTIDDFVTFLQKWPKRDILENQRLWNKKRGKSCMYIRLVHKWPFGKGKKEKEKEKEKLDVDRPQGFALIPWPLW